MKVLIADDTGSLLSLLSRRLKDWGYEVVAVQDGAAAWDALQRDGAPRLAILDWMLPGISGLELCTMIRATPGRQGIYVILLTGRGKEDMLAGFQAGADDYLTKPFDDAELRARVQVGERVVRLQTDLANRVNQRTTELSHATAELERWQQRTDVILDTAHDAFVAVDANSAIIDWNRQAEVTFGWPRAKVLGQSLTDLVVPPALRETFESGMREFGETGAWPVGNDRFETVALRHDGQEFPVELSVWPLRLGDGYTLNAFVRDITERKRVEQELKAYATKIEAKNEALQRTAAELASANESLWKTEERFRLLVDGVKDYAICMLDPAGFIVSWNAGAERIKGYDAEEIIGRHFSCFYDPDDSVVQTPDQDLQSAAIEGRFDREGWRIRKDGSKFLANVIITALRNREGTLQGFSKVTCDITDRRRAEQALQDYAAKLESTNEDLQKYAAAAEAATLAKSEFLANMSHELRTPLNAILGFSEGLLERAEKHPLNGHQKDRLTKIKQSGEHLLSLINNVLDIAKVEAGQMRAHAVRFDVAALAAEVSDLATALLSSKPDVRFVVDLDTSLITLTSDRDKVKQILINLVSNAIKFTDRGSVTLDVRADGDDYVRMSVEDTGIGIPKDHLPRVFEKFHQVDTFRGGTGLGLSICQTFADLIGASLTVRSIEGQGSSFSLCVPLVLKEQQTGSLQKSLEEIRDQCRMDAASTGAPKILCIEDNPTNLLVLCEYLVDAGYAVLPALNSEEGLSLALAEQPEAITLDLMMPLVDGWEILRQLKGDRQTRNIPVIMTTAIDNQEVAFSLGSDGYLVKPISRTRLLETIQRLLSPADHAPRTIALVGRDAEVCDIVMPVLREEGYRVRIFQSDAQFLADLEKRQPDAVIFDLTDPECDFFEGLKTFHANPAWSSIPVLVVADEVLAVAGFKELTDVARGIIPRDHLRGTNVLRTMLRQLALPRKGMRVT